MSEPTTPRDKYNFAYRALRKYGTDRAMNYAWRAVNGLDKYVGNAFTSYMNRTQPKSYHWNNSERRERFFYESQMNKLDIKIATLKRQLDAALAQLISTDPNVIYSEPATQAREAIAKIVDTASEKLERWGY